MLMCLKLLVKVLLLKTGETYDQPGEAVSGSLGKHIVSFGSSSSKVGTVYCLKTRTLMTG